MSNLGLFKQTAGKHPVSQIFPVNMIFWNNSPWGTIKYAWGLIPEGVHGDLCQLPDCKFQKDKIPSNC